MNLLLISGILKAVHCGVESRQNRVTKDVVAFYAGDFPDLVEKLQLDLHEPPISQVRLLMLITHFFPDNFLLLFFLFI